MDKKKMEEQISKVRKKAVEVDRAITEAKRARKAEEKRMEAQPQTPADESDPMNFNKIIDEGDALRRAILYLSNFDARTTYKRGILTEGQFHRLKESFTTKKEREILNEVGLFYDALINYTKYLIGLRKMWQTEAGNIALLCTKWEHYDREAEGWSIILQRLYEGSMIAKDTEGNPIDFHNPQIVETYFRKLWQGDPKEVELRAVETAKDEQGRPLFKLVADVDIKGGLYSKIEEQRDEAQYILELLRSGIEPFSDFLLTDIPLLTGGTLFPYTTILPRNAEAMLDYPDAIAFMHDPQGDKYFSYRIRQRREKGETITPEEEHRAVIPDYNQTHVNAHGTASAIRKLKEYFPNYYDRTD